jgi:hypothetical protein
MLDTRETLDKGRRFIVNIETKVNVPQAIADGTCKDKNNPKEIEKVSRQQADYIDWVWVKHERPGVSYKIHIESGRIQMGHGRWYNCPTDHSVSMLEHEFSHAPLNIKHSLDKHINIWLPQKHKRDGILNIYQQRLRISNTDSRPEYYNKSHLNHDIYITKTTFPDMSLSTCSRKCELFVDFTEDWSNCVGALIKESDDNIIPSLDHVRPL